MTKAMVDEKQKQVAEQCRAVAHMAGVIADVYSQKVVIYNEVPNVPTTDLVGERTADLMEMLGDVLNGMDAVTEEDDWLMPIFAEAHRRWPRAICVPGETEGG